MYAPDKPGVREAWRVRRAAETAGLERQMLLLRETPSEVPIAGLPQGLRFLWILNPDGTESPARRPG